MIAGNLLSANAESFDTSVAQWTATGATITRIAGTVMDQGIGCMQATATGAAEMVMTCTETPLVTPGEEYVASAAIASVGRALTATVELRWLDAANAETGTPSAHAETTTATGTQSRWVATIGTAPADAVRARVVIRISATAAGQLGYTDGVYLGPPPDYRADNLLTWDQSTIAMTQAGWTSDAPLSRERAPYVEDGLVRWALRSAPTSSGPLEIVSVAVPVTAGGWYQVGGRVLGTTPTPGIAVTATSTIRWLDADGEELDTPELEWYTYTSTGSAYSGVYSYHTLRAPAGAASARAVIQIRHDGAGDPYWVDGLWITPASPLYSLAVRDADAAIILTVDASGLTPDGDAGALFERVSVYRMDADGVQVPVRGYGGDWIDRPFTGDDLYIEDYEAPLGRPTWYRVAFTGPPPGLGRAAVSTVTVTSPSLADGSYVWLKAPGQPALSRTAMMADTPTWTRAGRGTLYPVVGRTDPVSRTARRASRVGQIRVYVWDTPTYAALDALLDDGLPLLVQAMPEYDLPPRFYVHVGDVRAESVTGSASTPGWVWTLDVTEIGRPTGGMQGSATRTWADVEAAYTTWDDVQSEYATWQAVLLDRGPDDV